MRKIDKPPGQIYKIHVDISENTKYLLNKYSLELRAIQPGANWSQSKIVELALKQYFPHLQVHYEQVKEATTLARKNA